MSPRSSTPVIKICGLSTEETLDAALAGGADMIGLVFHPKSPRYVAPERAAALAQRARGKAAVVGLMVGPTADRAAELADAVGLDWIQLHGAETPDQVAAIAARTGRPIVKALGIGAREDLAAIAPYVDVAQRILLDARPPKGAAYPGGHGRPFDWRLLAGLDPALRFMLSGGLDPTNVAYAIRATRADGVDVSSGVETAPGVKDPDRIAAFLRAARAAFDGKDER